MRHSVFKHYSCMGNIQKYIEPEVKVCLNNNLFQNSKEKCRYAIKYHNGIYYCHSKIGCIKE